MTDDGGSMDTEPPARGRPPLHARLLRQMLFHQLLFVLAVGALNIYNYVQGAPWWALWPSLTWGIVLTVHVCIVRSITVDDEWVDERAMELREHGYDFGHMRDLEQRIVDSDFSVVPPEERKNGKNGKQ